MALPPEPLEAVFEQIKLAVIGTIIAAERVEVDQSARPIGNAFMRPAQTVEIEVRETLAGQATGVISVCKPASGYLLVKGASGLFLIDQEQQILGRQGPDTWPIEQIRAALTPKSGTKG